MNSSLKGLSALQFALCLDTYDCEGRDGGQRARKSPETSNTRSQSNEFKREHEEMRLKHLIALRVQADAEDRVQKIREEAELKEKV